MFNGACLERYEHRNVRGSKHARTHTHTHTRAHTHTHSFSELAPNQFGDFFRAIYTLFATTSFEDWPEVSSVYVEPWTSACADHVNHSRNMTCIWGINCRNCILSLRMAQCIMASFFTCTVMLESSTTFSYRSDISCGAYVCIHARDFVGMY